MTTCRTRLLHLALLSLFALPLPPSKAIGQDAPIRVTLSNNSDGELVALHATTFFTAEVENRTDQPLTVSISWSVLSVAFETPESRKSEHSIEAGKKISTTFDLTCKEPGFADVEVSVVYNDKSISAHSRIGSEPTQVESPLSNEDDFEDFWNQSLSALTQVAPEFEVIARPDLNAKKVDVFEVRMRSFGGVRVAGWLEVPKTSGPCSGGTPVFGASGGSSGRTQPSPIEAFTYAMTRKYAVTP